MKTPVFRDMVTSKRFLTGGVLFFLIVSGFFLRYYHFEEWLYFKMDQARDAMLISDAVLHGPAYLPLLGPRVGAVKLDEGMLRVGPIYYYFQYLSGVLFGSVQPFVFAYPDLFFGTLAIPMFFLFLRLYFSRFVALLSTVLLTFSFLGIQYSRFAWNPNTLPFFLLLSFYGFLRFLNESDKKRRYLWFSLWVIGFGIGAQLHFFGMMSLLGVFGLTLLWHFGLWNARTVRELFTREKLLPFFRYFGMALVILSVLSAPIIASDMVRGGENTRNFFEAMTKKQDSKPILEGIGKAWSENGQYLCTISTALCTTESKKNSSPIALATIVFFAGVFAAFLRFRLLSEGIKKDFLRLLFSWMLVFFVLSIPVAFQLRPRFFLVVLVIPFVLWGVLFECAKEKWGRFGMTLGLLLFSALLALNMKGTYEWFLEQSASQKGDIPIKRTIILKNKDGVTLGQLQRSADFISHQLERGDRLYFYVKPEHIAPMEYLFQQKQVLDPDFVFENMKINKDPKARFFAIIPEEQTEVQAVADKFDNSFSILSFQSFGQIAVSEISFTNRETDSKFQFKGKSSKNESVLWLDEKQRKSDRIFWGDIFGSGVISGQSDDEDAGSES